MKLLIVGVAIACLIGCSKTSGLETEDPSALTGFWVSSRSFPDDSAADSSTLRLDLVDETGGFWVFWNWDGNATLTEGSGITLDLTGEGLGAVRFTGALEEGQLKGQLNGRWTPPGWSWTFSDTPVTFIRTP